MDVHAANDEPPRHLLQVLGEKVVALLVGVLLGPPFGEGVGGGGDGGKAELIGDGGDRAAQMDEIGASLLHRVADAGADLDLRAQEFGAHLAAQRLLAFGEQRGRRLGREVAGLLVDEEILFLDADGEAWFADGHGGAMVAQLEESG